MEMKNSKAEKGVLRISEDVISEIAEQALKDMEEVYGVDKQNIFMSILKPAKNSVKIKPVEDIIEVLPKENNVDLAERAYNVINDWIGQNINKFKNNDNNEIYGKINTVRGECFVIKSILIDMLEERNISFDGIKARLVEKGFLFRDNRNKYTAMQNFIFK